MKYLLKNKKKLILFLITAPISALSSVGLAFVMKIIVNIATSGDINKFKKLILICIIYILVESILYFSYRAIRATLIKESVIELKQDLFNEILYKNSSDFNRSNSGEYISLLNNDIRLYEEYFFRNICVIYYQIFAFLFSGISMIMLDPLLAIIIFVLGLFPISIPFIFGNKISHYNKVYSDTNGKYTVSIKDIFSGFEVIKSFGVEDKVKETYKFENNRVEKAKCKSITFNYFIEALSYGLSTIMYLSTLVVGAYLVITHKFTPGLMIAATQLMVYIAMPLQSISEIITNLKSAKAIDNKFKKLKTTKIINQNYTYIDTFRSSIKFSNVNFSYDGKREILKNINLTMEKGKKYVLVGNSGSGKSTLIKLLLKLYNNFKGSISIDNVDINNISIEDLNNLISVTNQNVFMFDDSIENNIKLYNNYSNEMLQESIEKSGLNLLVNKLDNGLKSSVGENGENFSGGEKQRIAIARALIKYTPIVILDEATSSLDNETAYSIEEKIINIKELTCIIITHKLNKNILLKCDEIIALRNGIIEERGTFHQLMNDKGYFYSLYNIK